MRAFELVPDLLKLIRRMKEPSEAFKSLLDLCNSAQASPIWKKMAPIDVNRDVDEGCRWLTTHLARRPTTSGVYLGLDTLNMNSGRGHNLEIGGSTKADSGVLDLEWMVENDWYGESHLIRGLWEMHVLYSKEQKIFELADYALFLGYSGIVLASSIPRLASKVGSGTRGRLYGWGFHDGDMFPLCRVTQKKTEILAVEE